MVLICVFCSVGYGLGSCLLKFGCLGLVDLVSRMLNMVVIMINFTVRVCKLIYASW